MGFLFSGLFWGIILILVGLSIILQLVFRVHIPLFRIVIALILIYAGLRVLVGGQWFRSERNTVVFEDRGLKATGSQEYNIVFGKANVDASQPLPGTGDRIELNTIFASSVLLISKEIPTRIKIDAAFAGTSLPDGNTISFGSYTYRNSAYVENQPHRFIDASVVFGAMTIHER